jgi:hypothetical protein
MANTDRTRKLIVRTALVTSSTFATIIGAQSLATLDAQQFGQTVQDTQINLAADSVLPPDSVVVARVAPNIVGIRVAPNITILRQPDSASATVNASSGTNANIQPPVPEQIIASQAIIQEQVIVPPATGQVAVPQPNIIQQPFVPRSRSSR